MSQCYKCGLPQFDLGGYTGPQCQCFWAGRINFIPPLDPPAPHYGQTVPFVAVDEATVRRIVREEIEKAMAIHLQGESARMTAARSPTELQPKDKP